MQRCDQGRQGLIVGIQYLDIGSNLVKQSGSMDRIITLICGSDSFTAFTPLTPVRRASAYCVSGACQFYNFYNLCSEYILV